MKCDRAEMLKKLVSKSDGTLDTDLFEQYIPDFYSQIYTLYSLLDSCLIQTSDIKFDKPIVIDKTITIVFSLSKEDFGKLKDELERIDYKVKYIRDSKFKLGISGSHKSCRLVFSPM